MSDAMNDIENVIQREREREKERRGEAIGWRKLNEGERPQYICFK
jgi:hypothetical protein